MEEEKWVNLYDYEGFMISNYGNIKSLDRHIIRSDGMGLTISGRELTKRQIKKDTSPFVEVRCSIGKKKTVYVLKAVADHFVPNRKPINKYVRPIDGNYLNTYFKNVKWVPYKEMRNK